jgi:hypothetical protein
MSLALVLTVAGVAAALTRTGEDGRMGNMHGKLGMAVMWLTVLQVRLPFSGGFRALHANSYFRSR